MYPTICIIQGFTFIQYMLVVPVHIAAVTYLIYAGIGWVAFICMGLVIMQFPIAILLAKLFAYIR